MKQTSQVDKSRRSFLGNITKSNLFLLFVFNLPFKITENKKSFPLKFRKYSDIRHKCHNTYKVQFLCQTKIHKKYSSIDDFWRDHRDQPIYDLNTLFRLQNRLIFDSSELTEYGYSAILTKEYRSYEDYLAYKKMWNLLSKTEKYTLYFQKV